MKCGGREGSKRFNCCRLYGTANFDQLSSSARTRAKAMKMRWLKCNLIFITARFWRSAFLLMSKTFLRTFVLESDYCRYAWMLIWAALSRASEQTRWATRLHLHSRRPATSKCSGEGRKLHFMMVKQKPRESLLNYLNFMGLRFTGKYINSRFVVILPLHLLN